MFPRAFLSCAFALEAAASLAAQPDHLMLGIRNLDEGVRLFHEQTGVRPQIGGKHPGRGTQNALASLGGGLYVEIIAPAEAAAAAAESDQVAALRGLERLTPIGWAVAVTDVQDARQRLTKAGFTVSEPMPGSRKRPDGSTLEWTTFGIASPQVAGVPFFIRWGDKVTHPSQDSPAGCRLQKLAIVSPSPADVRRALGALAVDVTVEPGASGGMSFTLQCPKGTATFGTATAAQARSLLELFGLVASGPAFRAGMEPVVQMYGAGDKAGRRTP